MFCKTWVINLEKKSSKSLVSHVLGIAPVKNCDPLMIAIILGACMKET